MDQPKRHSSETLARIAKAREHYKTRASRRERGQSMADVTNYYEVTHGGLTWRQRRPPTHTLQLRQALAGANLS